MNDELEKLRENLPPANDQAIASALNARAVRTVMMLNTLCASAEAKLGRATRALREAEARTTLLERALEATTATTTTREDDGAVEDVEVVAAAVETAAVIVEEELTTVTEETVAMEEEAVAPAETAAPTASDALASDPKYSIYFKMLKMGVPAQAVKNKMGLDGVDASVLDGR